MVTTNGWKAANCTAKTRAILTRSQRSVAGSDAGLHGLRLDQSLSDVTDNPATSLYEPIDNPGNGPPADSSLHRAAWKQVRGGAPKKLAFGTTTLPGFIVSSFYDGHDETIRSKTLDLLLNLTWVPVLRRRPLKEKYQPPATHTKFIVVRHSSEQGQGGEHRISAVESKSNGVFSLT